VFLTVVEVAASQAVPQSRTLIVNGQSGQVAVMQINGRSFVDLEALAQLANGSLGFRGNQIMLTLPASAAKNPTTAPSTRHPADSAFSKNFMKAGIEEMVIREWRSAQANAIQNGYLVTAAWVAGYRSRATESLRLASVAASPNLAVHLSLATVDPWSDLDFTGTWLSSRQRACSEKGSNWTFF
jgi:hypothetical protein